MNLTLGRADLKPQFKNTPVSEVTFQHLNKVAQQMVQQSRMGQAVFQDATSTTIIFAPSNSNGNSQAGI